MEAVIFVMHMITAAGAANAATTKADEPKVKYKAAKQLDFEQLVIEGQLKRPELAVVTGDSDENGNGLLRLREDFKDRMALSSGEGVQ